jgi:hypothetical protein
MTGAVQPTAPAAAAFRSSARRSMCARSGGPSTVIILSLAESAAILTV